jgi:Cytochrome b subunit of the bc complex
MSFWAATVITNLFSSIPIFGESIVYLLWGDYTVSNSTLNSFFSFHFLLPFILFIIIVLHLIFLHEKGSSDSLKIYNFSDKVLFNPYYTIKDLFIVLEF